MSDIQLPRDLSIGEQRFTELRQEQLVYVDKTAFVAKLVRKKRISTFPIWRIM